MGKARNKLAEATALRRRAEKQLKAQPAEAHLPRPGVETQRMLHELQVHQVELQMQNEELQRTRDRLESLVKEKTAEVARRTLTEQRLREQRDEREPRLILATPAAREEEKR